VSGARSAASSAAGGDAREDVDVAAFGLPQHERAQRFDRTLEKLPLCHRSGGVRSQGIAIDALEVGVMMTNVSTSASPVSTGFGGNDAAPIAERTSESTTTMRTNDVESTSTNGAIDRNVKPASTSSGNPHDRARRSRATRPCAHITGHA